MAKGNCQFNGTGGQYFVTVIVHLGLFTLFTLGIYAPWGMVRLLRLKASHTVINGKSVRFSGGGGRLFVLLLINGLLSILTLGLYLPWALVKVFRWKTEHTLVADKPSQFIGTGGGLFLFCLIHLFILPMLTLGIYYIWGMYRLYAWKEEHSRYGGETTSFGAGFGRFIWICLMTSVLNALTFSLFMPWALCMMYRWQVGGLAVGDDEATLHFSPVRNRAFYVIVLIIIGLLPFLAIGFYLKDTPREILSIIPDTTRGGGVPPQPIPSRPAPRAIPKGPKTNPFQKTRKALSTTQKDAAKVRPANQKPPVKSRTAPSKDADQGPPVQKTQEYAKEIATLDRAIKDEPENATAFFNRGWLYLKQGDLAAALDDLTQAISLKDGDADAYYNRGMVYIRMREYERAIEDFNRAIELNPVAVDAYCNRANAYHELGRHAQALDDYQAALKLASEDGDLYYNRAVIHLEKGDRRKALSDMRKAADLGQAQARTYLKGE